MLGTFEEFATFGAVEIIDGREMFDRMSVRRHATGAVIADYWFGFSLVPYCSFVRS